MSRKLGDKVTALLATFFVVGGGLISCAFIVLTTADNVGKPLLIGCGSVATVALLLWLLHDKGDQEVAGKKFFWKPAENQQTRKSTYKIKLRGHSDAKNIRSNRPPTVKTIRELSDGEHNWVPSDRRPKRDEHG